MIKHSKKMFISIAVILLAITAGAAEFYREIRPSVKQGHLAQIQDASTDLPDLARQIPFDGPVDYVQFHGYSARPPSYLFVSHLTRDQLKRFCILQSLTTIPSNYASTENPPGSWHIVDEFKLDRNIFAFRCSEKEYISIIGNTRGSPAWQIRGEYCQQSGLIVLEFAYLSEK